MFPLIYYLGQRQGDVISGASIVSFYHNDPSFIVFVSWLLLRIFTPIMYSETRCMARCESADPLGQVSIYFLSFICLHSNWEAIKVFLGTNVSLDSIPNSPWKGYVLFFHQCWFTYVNSRTCPWEDWRNIDFFILLEGTQPAFTLVDSMSLNWLTSGNCA